MHSVLIIQSTKISRYSGIMKTLTLLVALMMTFSCINHVRSEDDFDIADEVLDTDESEDAEANEDDSAEESNGETEDSETLGTEAETITENIEEQRFTGGTTDCGCDHGNGNGGHRSHHGHHTGHRSHDGHHTKHRSHDGHNFGHPSHDNHHTVHRSHHGHRTDHHEREGHQCGLH